MKLGTEVNELSVRSILKVYKVEVWRKQRSERNTSKEKREVVATFKEDKGKWWCSISKDAARGLMMLYDRQKLAESGGPILLNRHWAYSLLRRMNFVRS